MKYLQRTPFSSRTNQAYRDNFDRVFRRRSWWRRLLDWLLGR